MLKVIWGPPCSGKTTHCQKQLKDKDVVFDYDQIKRALIYGKDHEIIDWIQNLVIKMRGTFLRTYKEDEDIENAYLIVSYPSDDLKKFIEEDIGIEDVEYQKMKVTKEECLKNLEKDSTRPDKDREKKLIENWFEDHEEKKEDKKMDNFKKDRQYRAVLEKLETTQKEKRIDTDYYVEGYATRFEPYLLYEDEDGKVFEEFDRDCFKDADMSDVIMQFDHAGKVFARQSNGTLIVEPDDEGLFIAADLSKSSAAKELYEEIESGLITKMSWGFRLGEYDYDKDTRTIKHKSIKKIFDVSAVSRPANETTTINARSLVDGEIEKALKESQERERLSLKIKLELEGER